MKALEPDMIFKGEEIVHIASYHWIYVFKSFLPFVAILVLGTIAWSFMPTRLTSVVIMLSLLVAAAWITVKVLDTIIKRCYVTNRRLINRSGWTQRNTQDVTLDKIGGIFLDQTPMERFFGYGRIKLIVPIIQIPLPQYLRNPIAFRNAIYVKAAPKAEEKPDDEMHTEEHDRQAREEDDRSGAETVSFKELQEMSGDLDGENLDTELTVEDADDLSADTDDTAFVEADSSGGDSGDT